MRLGSDIPRGMQVVSAALGSPPQSSGICADLRANNQTSGFAVRECKVVQSDPQPLSSGIFPSSSTTCDLLLMQSGSALSTCGAQGSLAG